MLEDTMKVNQSINKSIYNDQPENFNEVLNNQIFEAAKIIQ